MMPARLRSSGLRFVDPQGPIITVVITLGLIISARSALAVVRVQVGSATVRAGDDALIQVWLHSDPFDAVAAVEHEIVFDSATPPRLDANQRPNCSVNPSLEKESTQFGLAPPVCGNGATACTAVRAVVVSIQNVGRIPDGALLYKCIFSTNGAPAGHYPLRNTRLSYATPEGSDRSAVALDGEVFVRAAILLGDANCDGLVNAADLIAIAREIFGTPASCDADCNSDHIISAADITCDVGRALSRSMEAR